MSTKTAVAPSTAARVLNEGYGPGAWHGPDLKAALADVSPRAPFWRPGPGRHSVAEIAARVLNEGYGPGAWHGPDLKAALADVSPRTAFWRPGPGRHSVAEIALHHAWCVRSVI